MAIDVMTGDQFASILHYLELDDERASLAYGVRSIEVAEMRTGLRPVPFFVSAITILMCESGKATRLAIEHGKAWRHDEPAQTDVGPGSVEGVLLKARKRPPLRIVRDK